MSGVIQVGIIGTGTMAEIYASIIEARADCKLVAVVGNSKSRTASFSEKFGVVGYADGDYGSLYQNHPEISTTIISTPEWVRLEPVKFAVLNSQHIILEKPFANNIKEASSLKELLINHNKVVEVCHVLRYSARFYAMKKAIDNGEIGEVRHMYARRNSNLQRVRRVLGHTDLAFWLTPHDIDIMGWLTGSHVSEVFARSLNGLKSEDDYLIANLRFKNGVDAVLENSWCTPKISGSAPEASFEVWGTKGSILLKDYDMNIKIFNQNEMVTTPDTYEDYELYGFRNGFFQSMINHFIKKIVLSDISKTSINDGVETIKVCEMIRNSIDTSTLIVR